MLAGHGSTLNADSSEPTYQHAETLRRRGIFAEVHECFWKEEPNFRNILREVEARRVYIVPNFISSGYFTEQVIPRELGLITRGEPGSLRWPVTHCPVAHGGPDGPAGAVWKELRYCQAVGLHPSMTRALMKRAQDVVAAWPGAAAEGSGAGIADPSRTAALLIVGHGTSLNDNSLKIVHEQAAILRATGRFAEVHACAMEQEPLIQNWRTLTQLPDVVVVPFFISDGLHSWEDIPVLLGVREQGGPPFRLAHNPWLEGSGPARRRLWYANSIGTEPVIADVILAQVAQFYHEHGE